MTNADLPKAITIIAGKGAYPRLLAESARFQGVSRIDAIAFRRETDPVIERVADHVHWIYLGQLGRMLEALKSAGNAHAVMAGQITPTHLFRVRMDSALLALLRKLPERNAHTIFAAIGEAIRRIGVTLLPASSFMEKHMPAAGLLSERSPSETETNDMRIGFEVAKTVSKLDIGQTVVIKEGTILAVEAFEGTDAAILRAGKLGGKGGVVVKVAKTGHDMRFDIPVIGLHTVKSIRKAGISAVAVEAGRAILLEREAVVDQLNKLNVAFKVMETNDE
jgi:DUF1009 family protein